MLYRGKKAVVYGASADAPEEANYLAEIGVKVTFVNPGPRPERLRPDIEWVQDSLRAIRGEGTVRSVEFKEVSRPPREAQGVFLLRDTVAPGAMASGLLIENGYIYVDKSQKTNIPGLFACGDCTGPPLQIAKAVGEGLVAGQEAARFAKT